MYMYMLKGCGPWGMFVVTCAVQLDHSPSPARYMFPMGRQWGQAERGLGGTAAAENDMVVDGASHLPGPVTSPTGCSRKREVWVGQYPLESGGPGGVVRPPQLKPGNVHIEGGWLGKWRWGGASPIVHESNAHALKDTTHRITLLRRDCVVANKQHKPKQLNVPITHSRIKLTWPHQPPLSDEQ